MDLRTLSMIACPIHHFHHPISTHVCLVIVSLFVFTIDVTLAEPFEHMLRIEHATTWKQGFDQCQEAMMHVASLDELKNNDTLLDYIWNNTISPIWTFGLEHTRAPNDSVILGAQRTITPAKYVCYKEKLDGYFSSFKSFQEAESECRNNSSSVVSGLTPDTVYLRKFANGMINATFWTMNVSIEEFLKASQIRCLLYDSSQRLSTDVCTTSHSVVCLRGEVQSTFEFRDSSLPVNTPESETTPAGTSVSSDRISISSSSEASFNSTGRQDIPVSPVTTQSGGTRKQGTLLEDPDIMFTLIGVGVALAFVIVFVIVCCCVCRGRRPRKANGPQLSDVYSDAIDSISMKLRKDNAEYAVPEDAICKARDRHSIGEGEYDTIPDTVKKMSMKAQPSPNIYSHVTVGLAPHMYENPEENAYDVSCVAHHKPNIVPISQNEENTYGHLNMPS